MTATGWRSGSDADMGPGEARRWVFLHGFTQHHQSWWPVLSALRTSPSPSSVPAAPWCLVDVPGHGASPLPTKRGLESSARHIVDLCGSGTYVGYSLGGRLALTAALLDADLPHRRVHRLVVISATAGIEDSTQRAHRQASDAELAEHIESIGTEAFIEEWLASPLFAHLHASDRAWRLRNSAAGLAASLLHHGTGQMTSLWNRLCQITIPVLVVCGEHDPKFTAFARRLGEELSHATVHVVADAGHSVPIEQPAALADAMAQWAKANPIPPAPR